MKNIDSIEFKVSTRIVPALVNYPSSYIAEKEDRVDLARFIAEWEGVADYFSPVHTVDPVLSYCDITGNLELCRTVRAVAFNT